MDRAIAMKYETLMLEPVHLDMYVDLFEDDKNVLKILEFLLKKTIIDEEDGVTKQLIQDSIIIKKRRKIGERKHEVKNITISRTDTNEALDKLIGATLVYYVVRHKEKPFYLTVRGKQVCGELLKRNLINNGN